MTEFDQREPRSWFRHAGIRKGWERTPLSLEDAEEIGRKYFADPEWGRPVEAFIWEEQIWRDQWECDSTLKAIGLLYAEGRVLDIRLNKKGWRLSLYIAHASERAAA